MNHKEMYTRIAAAELAFAHFNALRTAATEDLAGIQRGANDAWEYLVDPTRPASCYYNRAIGRTTHALSKDSLAALPLVISGLELTPGQLSSEVAETLIELGFRPAYQLCYLGMTPASTLPVAHEVVRMEPTQVDYFFDLLQREGVDFPPAKRARKQGYYCTAQFQAYVAKTADGVAAGWATMFVHGDAAFFGNAFTLPQFRNTGAHSALLAARLNQAAELGLRVAFTDVEHGSQSHYNCEQVGFQTLTINSIWSKKA